MLAFARGDGEAFSSLLGRYRNPVFVFILRSVRDRSRAEDVLQETWLKVVRGATTYRPQTSFRNWLYAVARNLCIDSARRMEHRDAAPLEDVRAQRFPDGGPSPDQVAHGQEVRVRLEQALDALPEEQREVFVLREYCGVGFKEIATITQATEGTVKSRMRYALETLRKRLEASGVDGAWDAAEERVG
jgi:RNA polymerase sigma-70 factor (ECF subfamily)